MGVKWFRALLWPATCLALLVLLSLQGSVPATGAQASAPPKPPGQDATKQDSTKQDPTKQDSTKTDTEEETPFTFRSGVTLVTTPVTVFDSGGQFVYDIDPNEFK